MPFPLIPVVIGVTFGGVIAHTVKKRRKKIRGMTPERQQIYESALNNLKDPAALMKLSDAFKTEGLYEQAELLAKRATLRNLPKEEKEKNRLRFKQGMESKNPDEVLKIAKEFDDRGATSAAHNLRKYASGLVDKK